MARLSGIHRLWVDLLETSHTEPHPFLVHHSQPATHTHHRSISMHTLTHNFYLIVSSYTIIYHFCFDVFFDDLS